MGGFDNTYECEIEIDRRESLTLDSDCDCPYKYDCQHLAAVLFYLEEHFDALLVEYSKETDLESAGACDEGNKASLMELQGSRNERSRAERKKMSKRAYAGICGCFSCAGQLSFFHP